MLNLPDFSISNLVYKTNNKLNSIKLSSKLGSVCEKVFARLHNKNLLRFDIFEVDLVVERARWGGKISGV